MNLPATLGLIYVSSELGLALLRRSGAAAQRADQGSLRALWLTITLSIFAGVFAARALPQFHYPLSRALAQGSGALFALGLLLRWWAILTLGKFFTVDVAIAQDHRLVIRGPYRWMRHPSYTGMLLAFLMLAVTYQNWISLAGIMVPISLALAYRIRVEETALAAAFGPAHQRYAATTKRLVPGVF